MPQFNLLLFLRLPLVMITVFALGCADQVEDEKQSPHTGNERFEEEKAPAENQPVENKSQGLARSSEVPQGFSSGSPFRTVPNVDSKTYFVVTNRLNVRSTPEVTDNNLVGQLGLNDEVRVVQFVAGTTFVQIEILQTKADLSKATAYYVSKEYLSDKKEMAEDRVSREKFFIIQNVASERMRVYQRMCDTGVCSHKMVLEAEIAVGEKDRDENTMTVLGNFAITKWFKFYRDGGHQYPSWYDPSYPAMPKPGSSVFAWRSKKVMPDGQGSARGAFGWYTAHVGPNSYSQWTHGTVGWGSDKKKFIKQTRGFWANAFGDPRSHGCSRTDNESIAYLRHLVGVGTPLVKIYAVEAYGDSTLSAYPQEAVNWNYILTKNGVRVDGEKADREEVLARGTDPSRWLEEGTYTADIRPSARKFKGGSSGASSGKNANVYGLKDGQMHGVFLVDEGRVVNYSHPSSLKVGGYPSRDLPNFMVGASNLSYSAADLD